LVIDAQLHQDEAVLWQGIVRIEEVDIGFSERSAHITYGRPVPFRKMREELHGTHDRRTAYGAERGRPAIRPIYPLSVLKVGRAKASDFRVKTNDIEQVNAQP